MITKREKLQYGYLFLIDLLSLVLSIGLAWGLTAGVLHKMGGLPAGRSGRSLFFIAAGLYSDFFLHLIRVENYREPHAGP